MKNVLGAVALAVALLILALVGNTLRLTSKQLPIDPSAEISVDRDRVASELSRCIQFRTVAGEGFDAQEFTGLRDHLEAAYPRLHASLGREVVEDYSLLFTWPGSDASATPFLLMGHLDVVPVEPGTEEMWTHPPFAGVVANGFVWGRGALDIKGPVTGILSAVEWLLAEGYRPRRTVYLAFGHNEETGGNGAEAIASKLRERKIELEYVLDEGLAVTESVVPGISRPAALVGIAEKGAVSLELSLETSGGHSAMPPPHTSAGLLSAAVSRLESHPFPAELHGPARLMFETLAPEMSFPLRALFSNLWLFRPLVERQLAAKVSTNAAIRTTTAVTMLESGIERNVLPERASAVVDFRILPGETVDGVVDRVRKTLGDPAIAVEILPGARDPSPISATDSESYRVLERTIREVFAGAVVAPGLVLGGTDSRHFVDLSRNVYRFVPLRVGPQDLGRFHGTDERISLDNLTSVVEFYVQLIRNSDR